MASERNGGGGGKAKVAAASAFGRKRFPSLDIAIVVFFSQQVAKVKASLERVKTTSSLNLSSFPPTMEKSFQDDLQETGDGGDFEPTDL